MRVDLTSRGSIPALPTKPKEGAAAAGPETRPAEAASESRPTAAAKPAAIPTLPAAFVGMAPQFQGYTFEAKAVSPAVAKLLEKQLRSGSPILVSGPATRLASSAGWKVGASVALGPKLSLRPVLGGAGAAPASGVAWRQAPAGAVRAGELAEVLRGPLEELAKTYPGLDGALSVVGMIATTPQAWNTIVKPGPKNKVDAFFAGGQLTVSAVEVASVFVPALHPWKHALAWSGVILKAGEKMYAVVAKPANEAEQKPEQKRSGPRK